MEVSICNAVNREVLYGPSHKLVGSVLFYKLNQISELKYYEMMLKLANNQRNGLVGYHG